MDKSSADLGNDLDQCEKDLDTEERELLTLEEQRLTHGRDITFLNLKRKDLEIPITQKKFCIRVLTRKYAALKRKFYQAKQSGL